MPATKTIAKDGPDVEDDPVVVRQESVVVDEDPVIVGDDPSSAVSWPAIFAGGCAAAALTLFLLALGAGIGLSAISPATNEGVGAGTVALGASIYLVVVAIMASAVGGYLAGRLRRRWAGLHSEEAFFRDTAHGLLAWAFATLLGAAVLFAIIPGRTVRGLDAAPYVDRLLRPELNADIKPLPTAPVIVAPAPTRTPPPDRATGTTPPAPQPASEETVAAPPAARPLPMASTTLAGLTQTREELSRLLIASVFNTNRLDANGLNVGDRTYMAQVVVAHTGLKQADAEKRVSEIADRMKAAADQARKAARNFALWLAASLLFGAFAASLAAAEGGGLRDGRFRYERGFAVVRVPKR